MPTEEEFRASGMTSEALKYPRSPRQIRMFAAFLNVPEAELPDTFKYYANQHMKDAWERVERVVIADVLKEIGKDLS